MAVETAHVARIARRDPMAAGSCAKDHRRIDHVVAPCDTKKLSRSTSLKVVQADDLAAVRDEQPR